MSVKISFVGLFGIILGCPDLTLDGPRMQRSHYIDRRRIPPNSCAIDECNTGVGTRLLLKFDGAIPNVGTSDLEFGVPNSYDGFVWDECHRHWHFNHFMDYQVFMYDNITYPNPVLTGDKRAFCLRDDGWAGATIRNEYGINRPPTPDRMFDCDDQGIHIGYQDVYGRELECQWIDITDLPGGRYKMRAEVNPIVRGRRRIDECGAYGNNVVWIEFTTAGTPGPSPTPRPTDRRVSGPSPTSRPTERPVGGTGPPPTGRPTDRPESGDDSDDRFDNRFGGSLFDRFFRSRSSNTDGCIGIGGECRFSSDCCGSSRCFRSFYGRDECSVNRR